VPARSYVATSGGKPAAPAPKLTTRCVSGPRPGSAPIPSPIKAYAGTFRPAARPHAIASTSGHLVRTARSGLAAGLPAAARAAPIAAGGGRGRRRRGGCGSRGGDRLVVGDHPNPSPHRRADGVGLVAHRSQLGVVGLRRARR